MPNFRRNIKSFPIGTGTGGMNAYQYRHAIGLGELDVPTLAGLNLAGGLVFTDTVWDDIRILPSAFDFAGNADPTCVPTTIGGMTFRLFEFAKNDEAFAIVQMPHSYKKGTILRPHVHWTPGTRGNEEAGKVVAWKADISYAKFGAAFSTAATVDLSVTIPLDAVDGMHLIGPSDNFVVADDFGESGMLLIRIYRSPNGDTWAGTATGSLPLLLEFDIHFQMDKIGSDYEIPGYVPPSSSPLVYNGEEIVYNGIQIQYN